MKPRLFVLGAGSSMPYGFPDGRRLIVATANYIEKQTNDLIILFSHKYNQKVVRKECESLSQKLKDPYVNSIDRLLANHQDNHIYMEIGEYSLLSVIADYEKKFVSGKLFKEQPTTDNMYGYRFNQVRDWMEHLFFKMFEYANHNLSVFREIPFYFASFNYDRLFVYKLALAIHANYPLKLEESLKIANSYCQDHLVHVHGSVGDIISKPFGDVIDPSDFSIKLVHQELTDTDKRILKDWFIKVSEVVFLGFGYHKENVNKLVFENIGSKVACGTFKGLGKAEIIDAYTQFKVMNNLELRNLENTHDCLGLLKEFIPFWDY
jgi:hypothetical protein